MHLSGTDPKFSGSFILPRHLAQKVDLSNMGPNATRSGPSEPLVQLYVPENPMENGLFQWLRDNQMNFIFVPNKLQKTLLTQLKTLLSQRWDPDWATFKIPADGVPDPTIWGEPLQQYSYHTRIISQTPDLVTLAEPSEEAENQHRVFNFLRDHGCSFVFSPKRDVPAPLEDRLLTLHARTLAPDKQT